MTVKQKIIKEIDKMPEPVLEQLYNYLQFFKKNGRKESKGVSESSAWGKFTAHEFLKGYSQSDEIYDKL